MWDDPALKTLNPGVDLPHQTIIPVHRTDGSGDTFIFSQYLSFSTPSWGSSVGYGTTISWPPVQGGIGAEGNPGMVNALKGNPYSIAYIGISFKNATSAAASARRCCRTRPASSCCRPRRPCQRRSRRPRNKTPADERISLIFAEAKIPTRSSIMNTRSSKRSSPPEMAEAVQIVSRMGDQARWRQRRALHGRGGFRAAAAGDRQAERHPARDDKMSWSAATVTIEGADRS